MGYEIQRESFGALVDGFHSKYRLRARQSVQLFFEGIGLRDSGFKGLRMHMFTGSKREFWGDGEA
jgi:hypothetical protein